MNSIGERIYEIRKKRNLSQGELAEKLDVSRQTISKWENNMCMPEVEKLVQLSDTLGVTADYILKGIQKEEKPVYIYVKEPTVSTEDNGKKQLLKSLGIVMTVTGIAATIALVFISLLIPAVLSAFVAIIGVVLIFGGKKPWLIASWIIYAVAFSCLLPFGPISPVAIFVPDFLDFRNDFHFILIGLLEWALLFVLIALTVKAKRGYVFRKR